MVNQGIKMLNILKEEALDRTMWTARLGRGFGSVVRQTTKLMNDWFLKEACNNMEKQTQTTHQNQ
jgi:hypothetical protein